MKMRFCIPFVALCLVLGMSACGKKVQPAPANAGQSGTQNQAGGASQHAPTPSQAKPAKKNSAKASLPGKGFVSGKSTQLGFIVWGGELPLFYGNGGLQTREDTIFAKHGLNLKLVPGDDMKQQLNDYRSGKTPFLRGTYRMIGPRAKELCQNPDLCPKVFMQLTWSAGDHMVCRKEVKELKDLKGKTIAIQKGGPHQGFLHDVLDDVGLAWSDVAIEWLDNLNGPASPPEMFKKSSKVHCAFAITPDMIGLTGGLQNVCAKQECDIEGAHVLVSTADRRKTIADVYAVSSKFYREHPDVVRNFAAAYLKSVDKFMELRHAFEGSQGSPEYLGLMSFAVKTWGTEVLPNEDEAHGLGLDASFVGHTGNVQFFDPKTTRGHVHFSKRSNDLAIALGIAKERLDVQGSPIDWSHAVFKGIKSANLKTAARFNTEAARGEIEELTAKGLLGDSTVLSFEAYFDANQATFDETKYSKQFDEIIKLAQSYTSAPILITGHTDSTKLVAQILRRGMKTGVVKQSGVPGNFSYSIDGQALDLKNAKQIVDLLYTKEFNSGPQGTNPKDIARAAKDLSLNRANKLKKALLAYAASKQVDIDPSQIQISGAGATDPFIVKPRSQDEAAKNRRVVFSVVRVSAESATTSDFTL